MSIFLHLEVLLEPAREVRHAVDEHRLTGIGVLVNLLCKA